MDKVVTLWPIRDLRRRFDEIDFPEYQREPTLWRRPEKQLLIDSMSRDFDIASLYLYETDGGKLECVDGRQRIGAIMSFLGDNRKDADNCFPFQASNEIYTDDANPFTVLSGQDFATINAAAETATAGIERQFVQKILDYRVPVVTLSNSERPEEFNLQFTRLNLGVIIISGERLRAMVGDLRDVCFDELGDHALLKSARMSTRRYAKEQTAAQVLAQVFAIEAAKSKGGEEGYARTRYFDLQRLFKDNAELSTRKRQWIDQLKEVMDRLGEEVGEDGVLTNRAVTVSAIRLGYEEADRGEWDAREVMAFLRTFTTRLQEQVKKGLDHDREYRFLMDFQREVTQASVEKRAVRRRAEVLREQFERWRKDGKLAGDNEYEARKAGEVRGGEAK